jgi:hypothetical protein
LVAISARSCSGRASASCNSLSAMAVMMRNIAPTATLTKQLQATMPSTRLGKPAHALVLRDRSTSHSAIDTLTSGGYERPRKRMKPLGG